MGQVQEHHAPGPRQSRGWRRRDKQPVLRVLRCAGRQPQEGLLQLQHRPVACRRAELNCGPYSFNGSTKDCVAGSAQERWLKADLASHRVACTIAFFHVPRFTSGRLHRSDAASDHALTALWTDLYAAGVDVVLNGHTHSYERFAPWLRTARWTRGKAFASSSSAPAVTTCSASEHRCRGARCAATSPSASSSSPCTAGPTHWLSVNDGSGQPPNTDHGASSCH